MKNRPDVPELNDLQAREAIKKANQSPQKALEQDIHDEDTPFQCDCPYRENLNVVHSDDDIPEEMRIFITTPYPYNKGYEMEQNEETYENENLSQESMMPDLTPQVNSKATTGTEGENTTTETLPGTTNSASYIIEFPPEAMKESPEKVSIQEAEEQQLALELTTNMVLRKRDSSEINGNEQESNKREGKKKKVEEPMAQPWKPLLDDIEKLCLGIFSKAGEEGLSIPPPPK